MNPWCPIGSLGLAEGRARAQQKPQPVLLGSRGKRRKTGRGDLPSASSEIQSQVGEERKVMKKDQRRRILQLMQQLHCLPPALLLLPVSDRLEERHRSAYPVPQGSDWLQACLGWGRRWLVIDS